MCYYIFDRTGHPISVGTSAQRAVIFGRVKTWRWALELWDLELWSWDVELGLGDSAVWLALFC